jgi:hypothetical protein
MLTKRRLATIFPTFTEFGLARICARIAHDSVRSLESQFRAFTDDNRAIAFTADVARTL